MSTTDYQKTLLVGLLRTQQIDDLHASLGLLLDMTKEGEIDLFLEQSNKSTKQKTLYIQKIVEQTTSLELKKLLQERLDAEDFSFFSQKFLDEFVQNLQKKAETIEIIKLRLAIRFKDADLLEMAELFSKRLGKQVAFDIEVDTSLIAGAVIQHGSYITDYSVKTRLAKYREEWKEAVDEHDSN